MVVAGGVLMAAVLMVATVSWFVRSEREDVAQLVVMNVDGSGRRTIAGQSGLEYWGPAWSPDGGQLVFSLFPRDPAAQADSPASLWIATVDDGEMRQLTDGDGGWLPDWSPDGLHIAFLAPAGENDTQEVFSIGSDGQGLTRLTNNSAEEYGVSWSPDGREIAFGSTQDGTWQIYVMKADGSEMRRLETGGGNAPAWSRDGQFIVFNSDRQGPGDVFVLELGTGVVRQLTHEKSRFDGLPSWSPDGSRIAFMSFRDGRSDIYMMDNDGGAVVNLTNTPGLGEAVPAWSPDGSRIAFHSRPPGARAPVR